MMISAECSTSGRRMPLPAAAVVLVSALLMLPRSTLAITWSVQNFILANLTNDYTDYTHWDPSTQGPCQSPGVCQPIITTIPANTTWAWCGWKAQKRTLSIVNVTSGSPISTLLMRNTELFGCAITTPSAIGSCGTIDTSLCDTLSYCSKIVIGLAFPDDVCFLVANNGNKPSTVSVLVQNYYDKDRTAGTAVAILLTALWCIGILVFFAVSCTKQYKQPTHRIDELFDLRTRLGKPEVPEEADTSSTAVFSQKIDYFLANVAHHVGLRKTPPPVLPE